MSISVCLITKNAQAQLEKTLESVKEIADEIIVADTGSTDGTKDVAKKYGAKVSDVQWQDDFSKARNESLKQATKEWILVIDSDEIIAKPDAEKVKQVIEEADAKTGGFKLNQITFLTKPAYGAIENTATNKAQFPFYVKKNLVRLFRNDKDFQFIHRVHELIEDSIQEKGYDYKQTDIVLNHFPDQEKSKEKEQYYSDLILKQLEEDPKNPRYTYLVAKMYLGQQQVDKALEYYKKTAELDPSYKLIFSDIAKIFLKKREYDTAIEYFQKSLEQNPDSASSANNLAVCFMAKGDFQSAKDTLEPFLKKFPNHHALQHNYTMVVQQLGKK